MEKLHFKKNHKGACCQKTVNPNTCAMLVEASQKKILNICELLFKWIGAFGGVLRRHNRVRFYERVLQIADMDHNLRAMGLL